MPLVEFHLQDSNTGKSFKLDRQKLSTSKQTFGVRLALDGNNQAKFDHLMNKMIDFCQRICQACLSHYDVLTTYCTIFVPSMFYSASVTNFTEKQSNKLMSATRKAFLPAMGWNRTMPLAVIHWLQKFNGAALKHHHTEQGLHHVLNLVTIRAPTVRQAKP